MWDNKRLLHSKLFTFNLAQQIQWATTWKAETEETGETGGGVSVTMTPDSAKYLARRSSQREDYTEE